MREPRVGYLRYELVALEDEVEFEDAANVLVDREDFTVELSRVPRLPGLVGVATMRLADEPEVGVRERPHEAGIVFKTAYGSEEAAREAVEPFLRAWSIDSGLRGQRVEFRLIGAYVEDNNPTPGEPAQYTVWSGGSFVVVDPNRSARPTPYPQPPPSGFAADQRVEMLWERWERCLMGQESLLAVAYFCLTLIEREFDPGGAGSTRDRVGRVLGLDPAILSKLGELSAHGDPSVARKFNSAPRPVREDEKSWIEAAVPLLIRRVGEVANAVAPQPAHISMGDLPLISARPG